MPELKRRTRKEFLLERIETERKGLSGVERVAELCKTQSPRDEFKFHEYGAQRRQELARLVGELETIYDGLPADDSRMKQLAFTKTLHALDLEETVQPQTRALAGEYRRSVVEATLAKSQPGTHLDATNCVTQDSPLQVRYDTIVRAIRAFYDRIQMALDGALWDQVPEIPDQLEQDYTQVRLNLPDPRLAEVSLQGLAIDIHYASSLLATSRRIIQEARLEEFEDLLPTEEELKKEFGQYLDVFPEHTRELHSMDFVNGVAILSYLADIGKMYHKAIMDRHNQDKD